MLAVLQRSCKREDPEAQNGGKYMRNMENMIAARHGAWPHSSQFDKYDKPQIPAKAEQHGVVRHGAWPPNNVTSTVCPGRKT
jgi:hypothetical protein